MVIQCFSEPSGTSQRTAGRRWRSGAMMMCPLNGGTGDREDRVSPTAKWNQIGVGDGTWKASQATTEVQVGMNESADDVTELVVAAANGDQDAWGGLVDRFMPLVLSVIRRYRLGPKDAEDISQTVWLRLVEHLGSIREPKALPGWLTVTTRNEALRTLRIRSVVTPVDPTDATASLRLEPRRETKDVDEDILQAERRMAVLNGLAELPTHQRDFLALLAADPPVSYAEISRQTGMPIGSIGPTRSRCLAKLRATAPLRALRDMEYTHLMGGRS